MNIDFPARDRTRFLFVSPLFSVSIYVSDFGDFPT